MDSKAWEYVASRESNRLNVLTRSIEQSNLIRDSLEELGLENSAISLQDRLNAFPAPERATLNRCFNEGIEGNSFYNAVAVYPIAGKILGIRYPEIFDSIYLIAALFADVISQETACLDIGTCTGFTPLTLGKLGLGTWRGIDRSAKCISYAQRCVIETEPRNPPAFERQTLEKLSAKNQYGLIVNSRGPELKASQNQYTKIASALQPNGFLVYIDDFIKNEAEARKIQLKSGLSLIYRDIVGGWCQTSNQFGVYSLSVFTKAAASLPHGDYQSSYETLWSPHFQDYCNNDMTDKPAQKSLCMMRDFLRTQA